MSAGKKKRAAGELRGPYGFRLRITRTGRTFLVVTLGVGLGALNTGNNLLYLVLGFLLSTIVVSGVLSERCLRHLRVRRLEPEAAFAGEPFAMRYAITRSQGTAFALSITEESDELSGQAPLPYLAAGQEQVARADLVAHRRGPHRLAGVRLSTRFPLGLFEKSRVLPLEGQLLVFPRRGFSCAEPKDQGRGPPGEGGDPRRRDGDGDLLGLRELAQGEDARRIHWLKSASAGKLLRTEREREQRQQYLLEIPRGAPQDLDPRCEEAAALAHRLLKQGHEVGLATPSFRLRPGCGSGHERRILRALALAGFGDPP